MTKDNSGLGKVERIEILEREVFSLEKRLRLLESKVIKLQERSKK